MRLAAGMASAFVDARTTFRAQMPRPLLGGERVDSSATLMKFRLFEELPVRATAIRLLRGW